MLELTLKHKRNSQAQILLDGKESHKFDLDDLRLSEEETIAFANDPTEYGQKLYNALFQKNSSAEKALRALPKNDVGQRRIILVAEDSVLDSVPWEYASNEGNWLGAQYTLLRALPAKERPQLTDIQPVPRLPIFFTPANPLVDERGNPVLLLDVETEWDYLVETVKAIQKGVDLYRLPPTVDQLQKAFNGKDNAIAHFFGHGNQDKDGKAYLLFEQETGRPAPLAAADFANIVRGKAELVFLGACLSARSGISEFSNLARLLVSEGVPYVIGMQFPVEVTAAERVTDFFYAALLAGSSAPEAMRNARQALAREKPFQAGIPVLYAADPTQARQINIQESNSRVRLSQRVDLSDIHRPESGFFGRQEELVEIGEYFKTGKSPLTVTLHGIGGTGKTALLWQAVRRFAWQFPLGALALSLEPLPTLPQILGKLESFLGIPETTTETEERTKILYQGFEKNPPILLALDNFETIVYARDDKTKPERQRQARDIFRFLRGLPARGVTLLTSSREKTKLPGEKLIEVSGLETLYGALLFMALAPGREGDLTLEGARKISRAVHGHPLALRLLGLLFDEEADLSLQDFTENLDEILPAAEDAWSSSGDRHGGLKACFDFSLKHLSKKLALDLASLSNFHAFFPDFVAARVINKDIQDTESLQKSLPKTRRSLNVLWGRGLLERIQFPAGKETLSLYRLHPALRPFAAEGLNVEEREATEARYWRALKDLGRMTYPANEGSGIYGSPILSLVASRALPDLQWAAEMREDQETSTLAFHTAFLLRHFGDLDGAMAMYQQAQEILEGLGDLQGKSATLHAMAGIYVTRGDLDGAMAMYQQALQIDEGLGDLQGKSATLAMLAQVHIIRKENKEALSALLTSLQTLEQIGARPDAQQVAGILQGFYQNLGAEKFTHLWADVTGNAPIPEWLSASQEQKGASVDSFVKAVVAAAKEKTPQAEKYFENVSKMARDEKLPAEFRELGKVLQKILSGEKSPDLSALPDELAEMLKEALDAPSP